MPTVKISGVEPDQLLHVETTDTFGDELGEATIRLVDTDSNRSNFTPDDDVTVDWSGATDWEGEVVGRPSNSSGVLTYRAFGESLGFKHEQAYRVFYETDSDQVVKDLATEQTEQLPRTNIHTGDTPADWSSQAPIAEAYAGDRAGLYEFGTDLLVVGAREGHTGEIQTTYTNVTSDAIVDGFFELETRLIFPAVSGFWSLTIELKTPGGTSYRWTPDLQAGENTYVLPAEEAENDDSGLSSGELRYRIEPNGIVGQLTLLGIDHAATIPFETNNRSGSPSTSGVESTGRTVTRRFDDSVGNAINDLAREDNAEWYIEGDTLNYLPGGASGTESKSITEGSTQVVDVEVDRDYEGVRNVVVVQGAGGIEVTRRDRASINFYGKARPASIVDPSIVSDDEAKDRGGGFLDERAFDDAEVTFSVANLDFAALTAGERISVTWSPENLDGDYKISEVRADSDGIVDVTISLSTARN